jgi:outer membrane protein OmpA-like peptidoglycan-associated protein
MRIVSGIAVLLVGVALVSPRRCLAAAAEERLSLRGELGGGAMLSSHQREDLGFDWGAEGSLRLGFSLAGPLVLQLGASHWMFPDGAGWGKATLLGGGLRLEPRLGPRMLLSVEADAGLGITGPFERFMFDAAVGLEMPASAAIALGPVVRYGQVVTRAGDVPVDAKFLTLGIQVALRAPPAAPAEVPPPPPPPPRDSDGDGVIDSDDVCPREPQGQNPDPARRGCPRLDTDGDGIFDSEDKCPTTSAGATPDPERPGCPDGDDDNDKVLNSKDQCRDKHQGINPDPERPGCPLPDRDNDSVTDGVDACPDKPGAPNPDSKKNGCPGLVLVEQTRIVINRPVYFATLKDRVLAKSFPVLRAVADALRALPEIRLVSIEGHTDSQGSDEFNADLSQRRANSVMQFLVQQGIEPGRLKAVGHGETRPVTSNDTAKGRAQNRRVEFKILDPASAPGGEP